MNAGRRFSEVGAVVAVFVAAATARAEPTKQECVAAATQGQALRDKGALVAGRQAFSVCVSSSCPTVVRRSCGEWIIGLDARIPKVAIRVVDANEHDVSNARVKLDDAEISLAVSVPVDPGVHEVAIDDQVEEFTIAEKESRTIVVRTRPTRPVKELSEPPPRLDTRPPVVKADERGRPIPAVGWVFGGIAVAGFVGFGAFGLAAKSAVDDLENTCAPFCRSDRIEGAHDKALVADISLGIAVAATIATAVVVALRR
jgi:hypothetical protein